MVSDDNPVFLPINSRNAQTDMIPVRNTRLAIRLNHTIVRLSRVAVGSVSLSNSGRR
ncbi:hypothetical protein D3C71_2163820 [compost metagenome]